jgi:hypothetical protein
MLGFEIDFWGYLTFLVLFLCVIALGVAWLFLAGPARANRCTATCLRPSLLGTKT